MSLLYAANPGPGRLLGAVLSFSRSSTRIVLLIVAGLSGLALADEAPSSEGNKSVLAPGQSVLDADDLLAAHLQPIQPEAGLAPESSPQPVAPRSSGNGVLNVPLEQLFQVPLDSPGTLTRVAPSYGPGVADGSTAQMAEHTVPRQTPAAVTRISDDTIWHSGARSLNEMIDIYVPDAEVIRHNSQQPHLGFRGIINDKDNKYLLNVNGRLMNNRTQVGSFSENAIPLLGDINYVDVLRGPASATYGPGALSGAVNITTYNGLTFQGTDATARQGFLEGFTTAEFRHGKKFDSDSGLFAYYGYADYPGASQGNSPYVFGRSFIARDGIPVVAGEPVTFDITNDRRSYRAEGWHKAYVEYNNGDVDLWTRYTRGGETTTPERYFVATKPVGMADLSNPKLDSFADLQEEQAGSQQLTAYAGYKPELTDHLRLDLNVSWDMFDFERWDAAAPSATNPAGPIYAHREEILLARSILHWTPLERHEFAVGYEFCHGDFGLDTGHYRAYTPRQGANTAPWSANTNSFLGEYQWRVNDQWTAFLSGRMDKEEIYTPWMYSPRAALVYMPTKQDTIKVIAAQSVRRTEEDDLRYQYLTQGTQADVEKLRGLELRYERRPCEHWFWAVSGYGEDTDTVTFARLGSETVGRSRLIGDIRIWGLEFEAAYHTEDTHLAVSHAYTKLGGASLVDTNIRQGITAAPYGYGFDLANWSDNLTKLYAMQKVATNWSASSSLRVYWGFPGGQDLALFNNDLFNQPGHPQATGLALTDPGYTKAFGANVFLDAGLQYQLAKHAVLRLDLYNILGWIDIDLNKRNYINRVSEYRSEAAALALSTRIDW